VLNVIMALPNDNEHWRSFKVIMAYNENIQAFKAISEHLEMEEEYMKTYAPPNVAFVAKRSGPRGNRPYHGKKPRKVFTPLRTLSLKVVSPRSIRLRAL